MELRPKNEPVFDLLRKELNSRLFKQLRNPFLKRDSLHYKSLFGLRINTDNVTNIDNVTRSINKREFKEPLALRRSTHYVQDDLPEVTRVDIVNTNIYVDIELGGKRRFTQKKYKRLLELDTLDNNTLT